MMRERMKMRRKKEKTTTMRMKMKRTRRMTRRMMMRKTRRKTRSQRSEGQERSQLHPRGRPWTLTMG